MRSRSLPETPFDFSLKMRSSGQTLSNALEISKNIARVSLDGYLSNALCISLVIERSWMTVEGVPWSETGLLWCRKVIFVQKFVHYVKNKFFEYLPTYG